ncbi:MAG TPA: serine hydrolase domain-containing protein [Gemmatimonadales bacterium]|jgi:CubicO group peptidase (beta-lactamase class C family)|nr:serine hydrolase domain-containing protein [Gemmatimonadales bacterium]
MVHRPTSVISITIRVAALPLLLAPRLSAQPDSNLIGRIRDSVEAWRGRNQPVGLAVGVYRRGTVLFTQGYGTTRLDSTDPVTPRTIFHLASVTKPFVATAIMQLAEQHKLDIDAPVTRYLPYFKLKDPRAAAITVKQLLAHTAGMPDVTDYRWERPEFDDGSLERYVRSLADSSLVFAPGTTWRYSNIGFEVLADVIAKVSGEPFEVYLQRRILTPLGMTHSTLLMTDVDSANLARGHVRDSSGKVMLSPVYPYNRPHAASSTLHSNVIDMLRWAAANLHKGELDGHRVVSAASVDRMWAMVYDRTAEFAERARRANRPMRFAAIGQGLGWRIFTLDGQDLVNHSGGDTGFRSDVLLWPADSSAVVVMLNDEAGDPAELSRIIYKLLLTFRT